MERVRKTFFDPLATSKDQIRDMLSALPVGSAHPFSPDRILLCRTEDGIQEIDISAYPEDFFFNAVDLGEMGEVLLRRMAGYKHYLGVFEDFHIQQAPASTFRVPLVSKKIAILAISERYPTYYDLCLATASCRVSCWNCRSPFKGIHHSGDVNNGKNLLQFITIYDNSFEQGEEFCVFISGYSRTQITKFLGTHPALLVANHVDNVLYTIPVPLDAATIGDATICCPMVIKRDGDSLICSILPTATTDRNKSSDGHILDSPAFQEAIRRADFNVVEHEPMSVQDTTQIPSNENSSNPENLCSLPTKENAVFTTNSVTLPSFLHLEDTQIINFGSGLEFKLPDEIVSHSATNDSSGVVLPCIFGSQLHGPLLLANGTTPTNVPFRDENSLRAYYRTLKNVVVIVDDRMTDNARNLASPYRINALFVVQLNPTTEPKDTDQLLSLLNSANINAVTALAGPQSLVLVQIFDKYYFYRGLANRARLNTSTLAFGSDVTSAINDGGIDCILDPRTERIVNLNDTNTVLIPSSGQLLQPHELRAFLEDLPLEKVQSLEEDIFAVVQQLQLLLNHKDLQELSTALVSILSAKVRTLITPMRNAYAKFLAKKYKAEDPVLVKTKNDMLGELRKTSKEIQTALEPAITSLANMMSSQMTSKRTHDLKRLARQAQIQVNVEATKDMTFQTLAGYLETYATDMGVMLLNIENTDYHNLLRKFLGNLKNTAIDASPYCDLDSRVLYLEGFDAGIIIEQSQKEHNGPLRSKLGRSQPILAVPYLNMGSGEGSMLAWVCWDEFVNLKSPYTVRWMEKCNEPHIAALRILMRNTLSQAVASMAYKLESGSPETGHLMTAFLMAAMSKLAAKRTTAPVVSEKAEDTVTRLMRGLFGNLLTIAGSGVCPLSMVWQLFGMDPQYDVPTTDVDWIWYETVVALYPYTGWPLKQFYHNLEKLLDKVVVRVVTKNENMDAIKGSRTDGLIRYCKLRNIQLTHSRTIITIFKRMLTTENIDIAVVATRLLEHIPQSLEKQSESYTRLVNYLKHLAKGGQRRVNDDRVVACVFTKRSAVFRELKIQISDACANKEWAKVQGYCRALVDKRAEIAAFWNISPESLRIQNLKAYKDFLDADLNVKTGEQSTIIQGLASQILGDAEKHRLPWQVGKDGQFGDNIEPLDEAFVHEILTGEGSQPIISAETTQKPISETTVIARNISEEYLEVKSSLQPHFFDKMQKDLSAEDACGILNVPVTAMHVFVKALNPEFVWEKLGENFKVVILDLVKNRSNRAESQPVKKLLELDRGYGKLQIQQ